jgi:predicted AlkP superfamily phosphohydrolase/phosphomutase
MSNEVPPVAKEVTPRERTSRLFIFGWDCADWNVVEEGWRQGRLPWLRSIARQGQQGTAMSTVPPVTALAWTSFLTGKSPGTHGIFGFRTVDPADYQMTPVPGGARKVPTLVQGLDELGFRSCQVTVPWTYPADRLKNGVIVPGWDAPDESLDSCHPSWVGRELSEIVDRIPRESPSRPDPSAYSKRQAENIELRERISSFLIERVDPHVFIVVYPESDQAVHHMWTRPGIPQALIDTYERIDASMGRLIEKHVREGDTVMVVSDHGALLQQTHVHVGHLLKQGGWLKIADIGPPSARVGRSLKRQVWYRVPPRIRRIAARSLSRRIRRRMAKSVRMASIDWANTRAFPVGNEHAGLGVFVNVNPPFRLGPVGPSDYDETRKAVAAYLGAILDPTTGEPVFERVARREDLYEGPEVDRAPDLVLMPRDGYGTSSGADFSGAMSRVAVGGHRREGIFAVNQPLELEAVEPIEDLLPKTLAALSFPVGRAEEAADAAPAEPEEYSEEESVAVEERLRALGYIE